MVTRRKLLLMILPLVLIMSLLSFTKLTSGIKKDNVTITNKGTHYEVTLNFSNGISHKKIGEEYATKILQAVPNYGALLDSYIDDLVVSESGYAVMLKSVNDIKPQIQKEYIDEIEGMASILSGSTKDVLGDGKVSKNELYFINLMADVDREYQCNALGVYGSRSKTNDDILERTVDWFSGSQNQLAKAHAVTTFLNGSKSICSIGYLGMVCVLTAFNDNKVFAGLLDSPIGEAYSSLKKRSYPFDLRYALENYTKLNEVANYMKSPLRSYTFNHLIFLSDPNVSKVLENNISGLPNSIREVRTEQSKLNDGITWGINNSIGCVNSFVIKGNFDNHTISIGNTARWDSMKNELKLMGSTISLDDMKIIAGYHKSKTPGIQSNGDLYNSFNQQIIIFEPSKLNLQIFFRPKSGILPNVPSFEKIEVKFNK